SAPDLSRLVPFGCRAVVHQSRKDTGSKMAPSGVEGIFINYDVHHHFYKIWIPESEKLVITHHVMFTPGVFPRKTAGAGINTSPLLDFSILENELFNTLPTGTFPTSEELELTNQDKQPTS
ncbi:uncharacterized protein VP01_14535g1, partial [Puccinia sorghi]